jgi:hypothetical protein
LPPAPKSYMPTESQLVRIECIQAAMQMREKGEYRCPDLFRLRRPPGMMSFRRSLSNGEGVQ